MQIGTIINWDYGTGIITIADGTGARYTADYSAGQTLFTTPTQPIPQFSGRHTQVSGHALKVPYPGDPIVFELGGATGNVFRWGYFQHYNDLLAHSFAAELRASA